ncbi:11520_t:CDS:2 [Acaulospora colombiana]|uniref:11520_t:CDS:1 n=1 Tax=Acaulospora colombiana TaxID=27376 RepID=A0ACA9KT66_9GLOM|nr:11520_t:CDS:2 [Acaulospora colombiana]
MSMNLVINSFRTLFCPLSINSLRRMKLKGTIIQESISDEFLSTSIISVVTSRIKANNSPSLRISLSRSAVLYCGLDTLDIVQNELKLHDNI